MIRHYNLDKVDDFGYPEQTFIEWINLNDIPYLPGPVEIQFSEKEYKQLYERLTPTI